MVSSWRKPGPIPRDLSEAIGGGRSSQQWLSVVMGPGSRFAWPGRQSLFRHPDLLQIFHHARMDQRHIRRRGDGVCRGGLAGLRKLLAERRLHRMQGTREMIGDVVGQIVAHEDKTP